MLLPWPSVTMLYSREKSPMKAARFMSSDKQEFRLVGSTGPRRQVRMACRNARKNALPSMSSHRQKTWFSAIKRWPKRSVKRTTISNCVIVLVIRWFWWVATSSTGRCFRDYHLISGLIAGDCRTHKVWWKSVFILVVFFFVKIIMKYLVYLGMHRQRISRKRTTS